MTRSSRLAAVLLLAACHHSARRPPIWISRIVVSETTLAGNAALGVTADQLKQRLVDTFDATGRFRPLAPEDAPQLESSSYRARVEVGFTRERDELTDGGAALRRAEVELEVTLSPSHVDGETDSCRAEGNGSRLFDPGLGPGAGLGPPTPGGTAAPENKARAVAFAGALGGALQEAAAGLILQVDASHKNDRELISDLGSPDAGVRDSAVRQLAERKSPAAVPALIQRLKDPDREVVLRAMGALEGIRDQRAVRPLIDLTEREDPAFVAQVVYVIGAIGGPDAEAFLFTLQNGSQDRQVSGAAAEASAELRRRRLRSTGGDALDAHPVQRP